MRVAAECVFAFVDMECRDLSDILSTFRSNPRVVPLRCGVQHYAWGSADAIPELLGEPNPGCRPYAELWIGAHPDLPARVWLDGQSIALDRLIDAMPAAILGADVAGRFGNCLPFLMKILSAAEPLSIQVHPDRRQARAGYARETAAGIPPDDPRRNYHDGNHKPELLCALTPFHALRGFRPLGEIERTLESVPEFRPLLTMYEPTVAGLGALYRHLMTIEQDAADTILVPLVERLRAEHVRRPFTRADRDYWVLRADADFSSRGHKDRGLFSIYLLNLLSLAPGEAIFLPAGVLHAYLEGTGVEVMANSNNVLRGGLTPKHVDRDELLAVVRYRPGRAQVIRPREADPYGVAVHFPTPAEEFDLYRVRIAAGRPWEPGRGHGVQLGIVTGGEAAVDQARGEPLRLRRGNAWLAPYGVPYSISSERDATVYVATVPRKHMTDRSP